MLQYARLCRCPRKITRGIEAVSQVGDIRPPPSRKAAGPQANLTMGRLCDKNCFQVQRAACVPVTYQPPQRCSSAELCPLIKASTAKSASRRRSIDRPHHQPRHIQRLGTEMTCMQLAGRLKLRRVWTLVDGIDIDPFGSTAPNQ